MIYRSVSVLNLSRGMKYLGSKASISVGSTHVLSFSKHISIYIAHHEVLI